MTTTNENLSHSDIKYNCLIGSTPDVIGELELDGTISFISPQVHDILGYHQDEMIGANIIKLTHPDDVPVITKVMKKAIKSKEVVIPKLRLKNKQGNYILVFVMGKLIKLTDKPKLIGVIRDITKIYETEKKLEESQNIFEQLNEVFLKFKEDPIINLQLLVNNAGLLLNADCALFNIIKRVNGKDVLESLVTYNEPPNFTRESDPKGHICTDIIKDNPDDVVILRNLDKTDYMKTDENVRNYGLKQYVSYVVRFNNKPTATFCVVYTENREMSNNDISVLHILSKSASTELARWNSQIELQESEEKYRSLVEGLDEALYRMSLPDGNYTYFSPAAKQVFGYSSKDFLNNPMFIKKISHPDFIDYFKEKWADLLKGNVPRTYEYKIIDSDNNERWIKQSNKMIFDSDGNFSAIEGLCRNITERKEAGQKLRESEDKYKNLFDQSPFAIVLIDQDGRIEDFNAQTENLLGYTNEEIVGKDFRKLNIFSHDNLPNLTRSFKKFIKTGVPESSEFQIYKKDGTSTWIRSYPIVVKIAGSSYILATLQDLTQSKKSEEQIYYQASLIENVSDAIISTDIDFNILSWNKAAEKIYGWSAKEVIGKNVRETIHVEYPYDEEKTVLETFFREGFWQGEVIQPKKDNSKIPVYSSIKLLKDAIGNPIGAVAINHDISDLKKTEEKLKESEEKFRNITEQNLMGIGILQDNTLKYLNKAMADIYGYSVEEVLNWEPMEFLKIFAPDTLEIAKEQGLKKQTGDPTQVIHYIVHGVKKTGELIWVDNFSRSITFEGRPADLVSQIDITEQRISEQKLIESESKFRKTVENSPDYILFINYEGIIVDVNRLEKGFAKNLVLGQSVFNETFYEKKSQCESARKAINDSIIHDKTASYEYSQIAPDGSFSFYETRVSPFEHDKENNIISLQLATRDITDRRKTEQSLKESEEKYRYFFDNALVGLFWSRITDGKFIECNDTFARLFGYNTREEYLADYIAIEHYVKLKDRDEMIEKIKVNGDIKNCEIQVSKRDGTPYWANISARINVEENRIEGAATDITERKEVEREIKERVKELTCLYKLTKISGEKNLDTESFLIEAINIIIPTWQFPELLWVKITVEGKEFKSDNYKETKWSQSSKIRIENKAIGEIEVGYIVETPIFDEGPFLKEERKLINGISDFISRILELKLSEQNLKESEARYKDLFENSPISLWEEDFSLVKNYIDNLKNSGIKDLREFFKKNPEELKKCVSMVKIVNVNKKTLELYQVDKIESLLVGLSEIFTEESLVVFTEEIITFAEGKTRFESEAITKTMKLNKFSHLTVVEIVDGFQKDWSKVLISIIDITKQKRVESEIIKSEKKIKDLIEVVPLGITISNPEGKIFEANSCSIEMFGFDSKEEFLKTPANKFFADPTNRLQYVQLLENGPVREFETKLKKKDGTLFWGSLTSIAKTVGGDVIIFNTIQDISQRKIDEEIIVDMAKFPAEDPNPVLRVSKEFVLYINQAGTNLFQVKVGNRIPLALENYVRITFNENKNLNSEIQLNSHIYSVFITPIEGTEYVNIYGMDITERTIAEQKLKESQKKYKLLNEELEMILDKIPGLVFYKDEKNNIIRVNKYFADAHKTTKDKLAGKNCFDIYPKDEAQKYFDDDLKVIKSKKPKLNFIEPWDVVEGRRWVNSSKIPLFDENNKSIGIIGVSTDVTAQVKAEQKLIESEAKYRTLVKTAEMGLVEFDVIGNKVSYINPKLLRILGYVKDELYSEKIFMDIVHPEDIENLIRGSEDKHVEFRIYTKDHKLRWLSGIRSNQYDKEGKILSARLWLEDTTERDELEELKSNLLTRFSHEFKTPLISITGFADLLLTENKKNLDEKTLSFLNRIKEGSDRLKMLINSFVESSELDEDIMQVSLKQENLYDLISEALNELEGAIYMREHEINLNVDKNLITTFDKEKMHTVITNLLVNAINYTQKGGKISICSKIERKSIIISIKDTGIGLDESEIIRLFKPFGKIERYGKGWDILIGGMGMGLYISKEIVELHDGKIWAESEGRNKGSTFYFSIPIME